ncbi:MAG: DNA alkylation repair protein [Alistipes sp.]|nr:DNA alkylation repair protein [Candidatus Alistipes equi]
MDNTRCMVDLLQKLKKQMNGAMLDTFLLYGKKYGVSYGVSVVELRNIAKTLPKDDSLFRFLFRQQVRELRIISLFVAQSEMITPNDADFLQEGVVNSEMAELAAKFLFCKTDCLLELLQIFLGRDEIMTYSLVMALSYCSKKYLQECSSIILRSIESYPDSRLVAMAVTAVLDEIKKENRALVDSVLCMMPESLSSDLIREEMEWRLEY